MTCTMQQESRVGDSYGSSYPFLISPFQIAAGSVSLEPFVKQRLAAACAQQNVYPRLNLCAELTARLMKANASSMCGPALNKLIFRWQHKETAVSEGKKSFKGSFTLDISCTVDVALMSPCTPEKSDHLSHEN